MPIVGRLAGSSSQGLKLLDEHPGGIMTPKVFPQRVRYHRQNSTSDLPARSLGDPIETGGEFFAGGRSVSLILDPSTHRLKLLLSDGEAEQIDSIFEYAGRIYVPPGLSASFQKAIVFPEHARAFGSTAALFAAIKGSLTNLGLPEQVALITIYFVLSSWFTEILPAAPFLLISGPRAEADLLLALLSCLVRHPLPLAQLSVAGLRSLPLNLRPTLLIDDELMRGPLFRLLAVSNNRHANIISRDGVVNAYGAKALYVGPVERDDSFGGTVMHINLLPSDASLPILSQEDRYALAARFQPALLGYRVKYIGKVNAAQINFPDLHREVQALASLLAGCIVDAPELQAEVSSVFESQQNRLRTERWLDPPCVVIEAMLSRCHRKQQEGDALHIGEIAKDAAAIFKGRGEAAELAPRAIGAIVRALGLVPKRDGQGYCLQLTDALCRRIHKLARQFDVAAVQEGSEACPYCGENSAEKTEVA